MKSHRNCATKQRGENEIELDINETERLCTHCNKIRTVDNFLKCNRSRGGRKSYCKFCAKEMKRKYKESHPVEHKIRQMAENIHKRLVSNIDKPANKSYKEKGIESKIGNNSAEIYKYLFNNFYEDVKSILKDGKVPSIDRIDSNKHYEDGNLRMITFEENSRMGREKSKEVCSKPIEIVWDSGKIVKYGSVVEASNITGISRQIISNMLTRPPKKTREFKVKYI